MNAPGKCGVNIAMEYCNVIQSEIAFFICLRGAFISCNLFCFEGYCYYYINNNLQKID